MGADQATRNIVEETISAGFDDLGARLTRASYGPEALAELIDPRLYRKSAGYSKASWIQTESTNSQPSCERQVCQYEAIGWSAVFSRQCGSCLCG